MSEIADILNTVKDRVELILEIYPKTRNNDLMLQWNYLQEWEDIDLPALTFEEFKKYSSIMESIRRQRQTIQNTEKRFIPTSLAVAKRRKWAESEWREYFKPG